VQHGTHITVLREEAVNAVLGSDKPTHSSPEQAVTAPRHFVDATFGRGGHSALLLSQMRLQDTLTVFDKDPQAITAAQAISDARLSVRHQSFAGIADLPEQSVDGLLMDLGVSSPQLDEAERGFSFRFDAPLDMRMDTSQGPTVAQWLEQATVQQMTEVIRDYGEERFAFQIAKAIDARRQSGQPLRRTAELAQLVAHTVKTREPGQNPATRTFQAFRIFINAELEELQQALAASLKLLKPMGRLVVISFHSLEDRIVKQFIAQYSKQVVDRKALFAPERAMPLRALDRVKPSAAEVAANPRARSAIMRVAERTEAACFA
jgi:16S rRNA (cytosine1402-N4)-methyltransferase